MFGVALVSKQELYRQSLQYGLDALQAILDWFLEAFEAIVVLRSNQVYCRGRKRKIGEPVVTLLRDLVGWAKFLLLARRHGCDG